MYMLVTGNKKISSLLSLSVSTWTEIILNKTFVICYTYRASTYTCQLKRLLFQWNRYISGLFAHVYGAAMRRNNECASPWIQSFRLSIQQRASTTERARSDVPSCARDFACVLVVTSTRARIRAWAVICSALITFWATLHADNSWQWP